MSNFSTHQNTLKCIAPLMEIDGITAVFNTHWFSSDHRYVPIDLNSPYWLFMRNDMEFPSIFRGDYEDFLRELARQLTQNLAARVDTYMASIIQVCVPFLILH